MGFTTSRSPIHETPDDRPVASRLATWDEVRRLVGVMGELNAGIFELAGEAVGRELQRSGRVPRVPRAPARPGRRAPGARSPSGMFSRLEAREVWRHYMELLDETAAAGGRMFAQVHSRGLNVLLSFKTQLPFDKLPDLEAVPRAPADRAAAAPARPRAARPPGRGRARARRQGARSATEARPFPLRLDLRCTTRCRARTARWPRSPRSAASTRPRP